MKLKQLDLIAVLCYIFNMNKQELTGKELCGAWTALVTPFSRGRVNAGKITELVSFASNANITGVVPLGSTGESASLDEFERVVVISAVIEAANRKVDAAGGKLKVMVGVGTNNTTKTIVNVKQAADLGADAVLVVAPYYSKPTPEGLRKHFLSIADVSPLPIVLYHIPSRCGVGIPMDLVVKLSKHPRIIGIKEAGGDIWRSGEIARLTNDGFTVFSGDDPLTLPLMAVGATGVISVISNIAPRQFGKMISHCLIGDYKSALEIHQRLSPLLNALGLETNPAPIKEAMNITGMKVGKVRSPLAPVTAATRKVLRQVIEQTDEPHIG